MIDPPGVDYGLNLNETLLPQYLKAAGWATAAVGKYHLGMARWEQTPTFRGFDFFHGYYSGGQDYYTHMESGGFDLHVDKGPNCGAGCSQLDFANNGTYSTTLYSSVAVDLIKQHAATAPDTPMFMYLAYQAVHSPDQVPESYVAPYKAKFPGNPQRATFAGMLACLSEGVGNVTRALNETGMLDNTIIVFAADNGCPISCPNSTCGDATGCSNFPLRGGKHSLFDGGVRGFSLIQGPGIQDHGVNRSGLFHHVDWLPTLLDAVGVQYQPDPAFPLHGSSQWPMIATGAPSTRTEVLLNIDPLQSQDGVWTNDPPHGMAGLRAGNFTLLVGQVGAPWGWSPQDVPQAAATGAAGAAGAASVYYTAVEPSHVVGEFRRSAVAAAAGSSSADRVALWPLVNMTVQLYEKSDIRQETDVSAQYPDVVSAMLQRIEYWATQVQVYPLYCNNCTDPRSNPASRNHTWYPWLD